MLMIPRAITIASGTLAALAFLSGCSSEPSPLQQLEAAALETIPDNDPWVLINGTSLVWGELSEGKTPAEATAAVRADPRVVDFYLEVGIPIYCENR